MLNFTNAPPGIEEYSKLVANLTNEQLFDRIAALGDRYEADGFPGELRDTFLWTIRIEVEELRHRLGTWMAVNCVVLPAYSGPTAACPKCGANGKGDLKTAYHAKPETDSICWGRLEEGREHVHRMCKRCGFEWLESCANSEQPRA
jgi:hypothetical protein